MALDCVLAIGTTNPGKVEAVRTAISAYDQLRFSKLEAYKVSSGVTDQPMSMAETLTGAKNRAKSARETAVAAAAAAGDCCGDTQRSPARRVLGLGMESGLFRDPDGAFYDLTCCAFFDGDYFHVGYSCAWRLPDEVSKLIEGKGMDMSEAANAARLCSDPYLGDKGGLIGVLTGGRVTRPQYTVQSIQMAILSMDPKLYRCSIFVPAGINDPPSAVWKNKSKAVAAIATGLTAGALLFVIGARR